MVLKCYVSIGSYSAQTIAALIDKNTMSRNYNLTLAAQKEMKSTQKQHICCKKRRQISGLSFSADLTIFSGGMIFGWASPSLPKLLKDEKGNIFEDDAKEFRITPDEGSWIVSLTSFGAVFGPILSNLLVDRIGRKWCLILVVIPILVSWLVIGLAESVEMLYVGRFVGGLSLGAVYSLLPMYFGEIAEDSIRGALGTLMSTIVNIGMLVSFSVGPWISRRMLAAVSAIPPLLFLLLSPWMPETPYYFLIRDDRKRAMKSLARLRQKSDVKEELASLESIVKKEQKDRDGFGISRLLRTSANRRALVISVGLLSLQQFSGVIAIQSYASLIFESSGFFGWSSYSVIIMGLVKLLAGISVIFVIDVAGRRPILFLSSFFTAVFLLIEAIFFHLKNLGYETSPVSWIPLVGIIGFYFAYIPGLGSVPYAMIGELFPTNVKAPATMLLSMYGSAMGVIITKVYQSISQTVGVHWIFYVFTVATFAGILFCHFYVPETKRLSLEEIQQYLRSERNTNPESPSPRYSEKNNLPKT